MVAKKQKASISQIEKNKLKARMRRVELCITTVIFVKSLYMVISFYNIEPSNKQVLLECNKKSISPLISILLLIVLPTLFFL